MTDFASQAFNASSSLNCGKKREAPPLSPAVVIGARVGSPKTMAWAPGNIESDADAAQPGSGETTSGKLQEGKGRHKVSSNDTTDSILDLKAKLSGPADSIKEMKAALTAPRDAITDLKAKVTGAADSIKEQKAKLLGNTDLVRGSRSALLGGSDVIAEAKGQMRSITGADSPILEMKRQMRSITGQDGPLGDLARLRESLKRPGDSDPEDGE